MRESSRWRIDSTLGPSCRSASRFSRRIPNLIGLDGLHPTIEGQTRIAEAFRDEIVRRYDGGSTTSLRFFYHETRADDRRSLEGAG